MSPALAGRFSTTAPPGKPYSSFYCWLPVECLTHSRHSTNVCQIVVKFKNGAERDFPSGPMVKNTSSNAGDLGSIPGWGTKIPHAGGVGLWATKPTRHNY